MFIKLTRLDNSPIWINAAFVVTVEPRKGGGSVVVPIGDGLDYDVKESPEQALAILSGAPTPEIVPIPTSDALTATPADVSPDPIEPEAVEVKMTDDATPTAAKPMKAAPAKKPRKTATVKKPRASRKKKPALPLPDDQLERLKKMMPKSIAKLKNTLVTQFKIEHAEDAVVALEANGLFTLDGNHVIWAV